MNIWMSPTTISTTYGGYPVLIDKNDILVLAPDGDLAYFKKMPRVRLWVKRKRKELA